MPTTLRTLLSERAFSLHPLVPIDDEVLAREIAWAHSSDLPDPTPWLESGGLLLTDGVQFSPPHPAPVDDYVRRLVAHGVLALGFATRIVHDEVPPGLVEASAAHGLALIEVPQQTPFMGVIRFVSDANAADERQRLERSLAAQRSIVRAALRPDGLASILRELERNLDAWVALFDAAGTRVTVAGLRPAPEAVAAEVDAAVAEVLARGRTAAVRLTPAGSLGVTLQTLGHGGGLRGVLAVGAAPTAADRAGADLIDAVIALASIALEQSRTLDDARRRLRTGILELLAGGVTDVAERAVAQLWGPLPAAPFQVVSIAAGGEALPSALELFSDGHHGSFFFAEQDDTVIAVTPPALRGELAAQLGRAGATAGASSPAGWDAFAEAVSQSRRALARASAQHPWIDFDDLAHAGLLGHLEQTRAHEVARRILLPLHVDGAPADLRRTLEVWLAHNCGWDAAAKQLGIHRHTLRHRVQVAAGLLGLDLDTFGARAELWSALQLTASDPR